MGLVLMSIITAQVSSSLTADEMQPLDEVFGNKVMIMMMMMMMMIIIII